MKNTLYYISAIAMLFLSVGCAKEKILPVFGSDDRAIRIAPEITSNFVKSNPAGSEEEQLSFNQGDMIILSCEDGNVIYSLSSSGWMPTDNYYLRWGKDPVTYKAYYPASAISVTDKFTVPANQRSLEALSMADYMTCTVNNAVYESGGTLNLPLERKMAKVIISVHGLDPDSRIQGMRIISGEGYSGEEVSDTRISVTPYTEPPAGGISGQEGTVYTALVTPSEELVPGVFSTFHLNGKELSVPGYPELLAGREYRFSMDIENSTIAFSDPAYGDWNSKIVPEGSIQIITNSYYIKETATGDASGADWDNAMDAAGFVNLLQKSSDPEISDINADILDGATIHMAGGNYDLSGSLEGQPYLFVEYSGYSSQVKLKITGGYDPASTGTDISIRDTDRYETVLSGNGKTSLLNFGNQTDVTFDGITFADGTGVSGASAGAISIAHGGSGNATVTLQNCIIRNCYRNQGGAITCNAGFLRLNNVFFTGNRSDNRGIIKMDTPNAIVFANDCVFKGNSQGGSFGYAIHASNGHLCMNNCVITDNTGTNGAVNGAGSICLVNSTIISDNSGGAIRCESASSRNSMLMNCIIINKMSGQNSVDMSNSTGYLTSKGFNLLGSGIHETNGTGTQFIVNSSDIMDCSPEELGLVFDESLNAFTWDGNISVMTTANDIKAAIQSFRPEGHTSLGEDFINWLESIDGFSTDICGNIRDTGAMWPGAYQK